MQDRYVGDIGDFAKYSLLRSTSKHQRLGIAWYLHPDEAHNNDGKHTAYLSNPREWRQRDAMVFDVLKDVVETNQRSVAQIELSGLFPNASFASERLETVSNSAMARRDFRKAWFERTQRALDAADFLFVDPDNGLREQEKYIWSAPKNWKSIPEQEALRLAEGRTVAVYHHNTRRPGGHEKENEFWAERLSAAFAVRMRAFSARTFFFLNPTPAHLEAARSWCARWGEKYSITEFK